MVLPTRLDLLVVFGLVLGGCLIDEAPCGLAMHLMGDVCVCDDGAIAVTGGCHVCAGDEIAVANVCTCAPGSGKNLVGVCAAVDGLGDHCDATTPCATSPYLYCATTDATSVGTCTNTCADDAGCDVAYTCATWEVTPSCQVFSGVGASCTTKEDCAGFDASGCDTFVTHTCLVVDCTLAIDDCPRDTGCCDLSAFGLTTACLAECP